MQETYVTRRKAIGALVTGAAFIAASPSSAVCSTPPHQDVAERTLMGNACSSLVSLFDAIYFAFMGPEYKRLRDQLKLLPKFIGELIDSLESLQGEEAWQAKAENAEQSSAKTTTASLIVLSNTINQMIAGDADQESLRLSPDEYRATAVQARLTWQLVDQVLRGLIDVRRAIERIGSRASQEISAVRLDSKGDVFIEQKVAAWPTIMMVDQQLMRYDGALNILDRVWYEQREAFLRLVADLNSGKPGSNTWIEDYRQSLIDIAFALQAFSNEALEKDSIRVDAKELKLCLDTLRNLSGGTVDHSNELVAAGESGVGCCSEGTLSMTIKQAIHDLGGKEYWANVWQVAGVRFSFNATFLVFNEQDRIRALATAIHYLQPSIPIAPDRFQYASAIATAIIKG